MNTTDEGTTPEHDDDILPEERDAEEHPPSEGRGPVQGPAPAGNPETDDEAVEKGEEQIGKVVGR